MCPKLQLTVHNEQIHIFLDSLPPLFTLADIDVIHVMKSRQASPPSLETHRTI